MLFFLLLRLLLLLLFQPVFSPFSFSSLAFSSWGLLPPSSPPFWLAEKEEEAREGRKELG